MKSMFTDELNNRQKIYCNINKLSNKHNLRGKKRYLKCIYNLRNVNVKAFGA